MISVSNGSSKLVNINANTLKMAAGALTRASQAICKVDIQSLGLNILFQGDSLEEPHVFECKVCVTFVLNG
jgi:hypothetical protein